MTQVNAWHEGNDLWGLDSSGNILDYSAMECSTWFSFSFYTPRSFFLLRSLRALDRAAASQTEMKILTRTERRARRLSRQNVVRKSCDHRKFSGRIDFKLDSFIHFAKWRTGFVLIRNEKRRYDHCELGKYTLRIEIQILTKFSSLGNSHIHHSD